MLNYKYVEGDILSENMDAEKSVLVLHQTNCKGVMGAGLAKQVKLQLPEVYAVYAEKCKAGMAHLGDLQVCSCLAEKGYLLGNCFGQDGFGTERRQTDYDALQHCFELTAGYRPDIVRIPYHMGCGLAGGNWNEVMDRAYKAFVDTGISVEIWYRPQDVIFSLQQKVTDDPAGFGKAEWFEEGEKESAGAYYVSLNIKTHQNKSVHAHGRLIIKNEKLQKAVTGAGFPGGAFINIFRAREDKWVLEFKAELILMSRYLFLTEEEMTKLMKKFNKYLEF